MKSLIYITNLFPPSEAVWLSKEAECFLITNGKISSVLPGDSCCPDEKDNPVWIYLLQGSSEDGLAGVSGVSVGNGREIGGWCTYQYTIAVPRRFVIRNCKELINGQAPEELVRRKMNEVLLALLQEPTAATTPPDLLASALKKTAGHALEDMGIRLISCRLERIVISSR